MKKKKTQAKKNYEKKKRMRGKGLSRVRACLLKSYKINKREERLRKVRKQKRSKTKERKGIRRKGREIYVRKKRGRKEGIEQEENIRRGGRKEVIEQEDMRRGASKEVVKEGRNNKQMTYISASLAGSVYEGSVFKNYRVTDRVYHDQISFNLIQCNLMKERKGQN